MGFRAFPTGPTMTTGDFAQSAIDKPLSPWATFTGAAAAGALQTPGLGTAIREGYTPDIARVPIAGGRGGARYETDDEVSKRGDTLYSSADDYKASPYFRDEIPFEKGMTESRAKALSEMSDTSKVREFYSSKRPVVAFTGTLAGSALDPINYIPIVGNAAYAASAARVGRIASRAVLGGADAAMNAAIFSTLTANQREKFGDDVSWNAIGMNAAYAALAGTVLGGAFGALTKSRLETIPNRIKSAQVLNDAIDGLSDKGEVSLRQRSQANVQNMADAVARRPTPDLDLEVYYKSAPLRQSELEDIGRSISDEIGAEFKTAGIKKRETAEEKIKRKNYTRADQITDIVRGGFKVTSAEQADKIVARRGERYDVLDEGWLTTESGYTDRKVLVRMNDGTIGEIQIWPDKLLDAKEKGGGHKLYKAARGLRNDDPKFSELNAQMFALYSTAAEGLPAEFRTAFTGPGKGGKSGNLSWKLASSRTTPAVNLISRTSGSDTQSDPGSGMNQASLLSSNRQGLRSQLKNFNDAMGGSPDRYIGRSGRDVNFAAPPPEARLTTLKAAEAKIDANPKPDADPERALIDRAIADAKEEGFDPEAGTHDLEPDIEALRTQEFLTVDEEQALAAADETFAAVGAWEKVMNVARSCVLR